SFYGRHVHSNEVLKLTADAKAHPAWTDADLATAIRIGAGKYPPNQAAEFADDVRLERSEWLLGRIKTVKRECIWRETFDTIDGKQVEVVSPSWIVRVESSDQQNGRNCSRLAFEQFDGYFVSFA